MSDEYIRTMREVKDCVSKDGATLWDIIELLLGQQDEMATRITGLKDELFDARRMERSADSHAAWSDEQRQKLTTPEGYVDVRLPREHVEDWLAREVGPDSFREACRKALETDDE